VDRAARPERSTIDIAITAVTPWLIVPSGALLTVALLTRWRTVAGELRQRKGRTVSHGT